PIPTCDDVLAAASVRRRDGRQPVCHSAPRPPGCEPARILQRCRPERDVGDPARTDPADRARSARTRACRPGCRLVRAGSALWIPAVCDRDRRRWLRDPGCRTERRQLPQLPRRLQLDDHGELLRDRDVRLRGRAASRARLLENLVSQGATMRCGFWLVSVNVPADVTTVTWTV